MQLTDREAAVLPAMKYDSLYGYQLCALHCKSSTMNQFLMFEASLTGIYHGGAFFIASLDALIIIV
jgi:hypothetical protein